MVNTSDCTLFKWLCRHKIVDLYEIHERTLITPADLARSAQLLVRLGLAKENGLHVSRSEDFEELAIVHRRTFFSRSKPWKNWRVDKRKNISEIM